MSDNQDEQIVDTPEETVQEGEDNVVQRMSPSEREARANGWVPADEWKGNPEDWKPAKAFNEFGELIGKYRAQNQRISAVEQALRQTVDQQRKTFENGYQTALNDLKKERRAAMAEGDLERADEIQDKIDDTKDKLREVQTQPQPQSNQPDPGFVDWIQRNPWYQSDKVMQRYADQVAVEFATQNKGQVTMDEVRDFVEKTVKSDFSHKFQPKRAAPSPDGEGKTQGGSKGANTGLSKIESEMSSEERDVMKTLMRATGMSKEEYLKMYATAPNPRGR